jgi:hypothetical protein
MRLWSIPLVGLLLAGCDFQRSAGGSTSETSNGVVVRVSTPAGTPAARARVRLRPVEYLQPGLPAAEDRSMGVWDTVTDDSGRIQLPSGACDASVEVFADSSAAQVRVAQGMDGEIALRLAPLARVVGRVALAPGDGPARVQARGLEHATWTDSTGAFVLDSLPSGLLRVRAWVPGRVVEVALDLPSGARTNVGTLAPGREAGIWTDSVKVFLNTLDGNAATTTRVDSVPILVRLEGSSFPATAKDDGSDLRVADSTGLLLPFHLASWSPARLEAAVWVLVPSVRAADSSQWFRIRWGNPAAADASAPGSVFPASGGWSGAWDLERNYIDPVGRWRVGDAASGRDDGILTGAPTADPVAGLRFTASGRDGLALSGRSANLRGPFTVLIRDRPEAPGIILLGRGDSAWNHGKKAFFLQAQKSTVRKTGWYPAFMGWADTGYNVYSVSNTPVDSSAWTLLVARHTVGTGDSGAVEWFKDGAKVSTTATGAQDYEPDLARDSLIVGYRHASGYRFRGALAEIWILSRSVSDDWIRLEAECRKTGGGTLVRLRP